MTLYCEVFDAVAAWSRPGATNDFGRLESEPEASAAIGAHSAIASASTTRRATPPVRLPQRALALDPSPFEPGVHPALSVRRLLSISVFPPIPHPCGATVRSDFLWRTVGRKGGSDLTLSREEHEVHPFEGPPHRLGGGASAPVGGQVVGTPSCGGAARSRVRRRSSPPAARRLRSAPRRTARGRALVRRRRR